MGWNDTPTVGLVNIPLITLNCDVPLKKDRRDIMMYVPELMCETNLLIADRLKRKGLYVDIVPESTFGSFYNPVGDAEKIMRERNKLTLAQAEYLFEYASMSAVTQERSLLAMLRDCYSILVGITPTKDESVLMYKPQTRDFSVLDGDIAYGDSAAHFDGSGKIAEHWLGDPRGGSVFHYLPISSAEHTGEFSLEYEPQEFFHGLNEYQLSFNAANIDFETFSAAFRNYDPSEDQAGRAMQYALSEASPKKLAFSNFRLYQHEQGLDFIVDTILAALGRV